MTGKFYKRAYVSIVRIGRAVKRGDKSLNFADFSYSLSGLIKLHRRAFRNYGNSGTGALNVGEACGQAALRRKIYNNFFADRGCDIFIRIYDKPSSIALAVNKIFYDFAKSGDDEVTKLARLGVKLFEANCFLYGNREIIYAVLARAAAEKGIGFELSFNMFSTILLRNDMDSDQLKLAESQLTLALRMLTKTEIFESAR